MPEAGPNQPLVVVVSVLARIKTILPVEFALDDPIRIVMQVEMLKEREHEAFLETLIALPPIKRPQLLVSPMPGCQVIAPMLRRATFALVTPSKVTSPTSHL